MKHYIAHTASTNVNSSSSMENYVQNVTILVGLISIITLLWKISSFMQLLNLTVGTLKKDVQDLELIIKKLHKRYENIHFFLIRQYGIETVNKNLRTEEEEND